MNGWMLSQTLLTRIAMVSIELVVLAALVWALIAVFRIRTPRVCAMLWLVVLAKPVLGLVIGAPLPVMNVQYDGGAMLTPEQRQAALNQVLNATAEPGAAAVKSGPVVVANVTAPAAKSSTPTPAPASASTRSFSISLSPAQMLGLAWAAIVLGMIGYLAFDMRRLRRMLNESAPAPAGVQHIYHEVACEMGIANAPELRVSDALDSPALGGVIKPVVLMPRWIAELAGREQIAWLVRHELMHYKQRDPLGLAVRRLAEVLFFFHPAVWWAGRKWEESMELACDRALLTTDADAHSYAEQLYWVLEHKANRQRMLKAGLCATRTQIGKRIASLLSNPLRVPARMSGMALSGLLIIALVGLTAGLGLRSASADQTNSPLKKDVADLVARTNKNLKQTSYGVYSYATGTRTFPGSVADLIAKSSADRADMMDPFTGRDGSGTETLKLAYPADYSKVLIYSVGPDGVDDHATIAYDPTNGTMSTGDIILTRDCNDISDHVYKVDDAELLKKLRAAAEQLVYTDGLIETYFQNHGALPDDMGKLVGEEMGLTQLPEDPFAPGRPIRYSLSPDKQVATIYSVGPDGTDDGGKIEVGHCIKQGETPKGDIAAQCKLRYYADRKKGLAEYTNRMRDVLVADRERDGRDNAMIHYLDASIETGQLPNTYEMDLLKETLTNGWTEKSQPLISTIARFRRAFQDVRKGAALDYAMNDIGEPNPDTPVPNFLAAQTIVRVMCLEGRYYESQKQYDKAIEDYLTALTMGRDYGAPNCTLISGLISVACQRIPIEQISRLAVSGVLDDDLLKRLAERLKVIEARQGDFNQWMDGEFRCMEWVFELARKDPDKLRAVYAKNMGNREGAAEEAEEYIKNVDRLEAERQQFITWYKGLFATPYWQRESKGYTNAAYEKMISGMLPSIRNSQPRFQESNVRYLSNTVRLGEARAVVALEQYRKLNGAYPDELAALAPKFIEKPPTDPFSGQPFQYQLTDGGKSYKLWSVGPDAINNGAAVSYDPTNGTISGGDISPR